MTRRVVAVLPSDVMLRLFALWLAETGEKRMARFNSLLIGRVSIQTQTSQNRRIGFRLLPHLRGHCAWCCCFSGNMLGYRNGKIAIFAQCLHSLTLKQF